MRVEKRLSIQAVLILAVLVVGVFGYVEIFTKGIDRLPGKVCSGAVDRDLPADILPNTMKAHERGKSARVGGQGTGFVFYCYVKTKSQDSILSGEVQIGDVRRSDWREGELDQEAIEVESAAIAAISLTDASSLYVPCTPTGVNSEDARNVYALIVDARTIGDTRVTGAELRQEVTDFGYQLLKHAYGAQGCQEGLELPAELPRFG